MRNGLRITLLLFLFSHAALAAEVVYVDDHIRLGVRAAPNSSEGSISVVTTGDKLTVLAEEEKFLQVRTESGVEGWVSKGYVSSEPPARVRLAALQQQYSDLQAQLALLQQELSESRHREEAASGRLTGLQQEKRALQQELSAYRRTEEASQGSYTLYYEAALLLALFIGGILLGINWYKGRVAERIGGLQI